MVSRSDDPADGVEMMCLIIDLPVVPAYRQLMQMVPGLDKEGIPLILPSSREAIRSLMIREGTIRGVHTISDLPS
jgi:hypothetical protein